MPIPPSALHDVEYWLKRAEEARTFADEMRDRETKSLMLGIAESYERKATSGLPKLTKRSLITRNTVAINNLRL